MKASELMNNDLFMYGGHLCRFVIRTMDAVIERISDRDQYPPCACVEAEPIPLTEEILKANGWKLLSHYDRATYYFGNGEFGVDFTTGKFRMLIHGRVIIVEYLHELQHILRLCGLKELADNFKITP